MERELAVIMTVHNRKDQTMLCLEHLFQETVPFDLYVTDDGCTDGTADAIAELYPSARIIKGDGSLFWNRGMYVAFAEALEHKYRYYLWLNDDTIIVKSTLSILVSFSLNEGESSILCGACVDQNSKITYGGYTSDFKLISLSEDAQECSFASGNIFFIPSSVAHILGNLDYYYRHSLGDFDYGGRAIKAGIKIIQLPSYLGYCEDHINIPKWRDVNYSFIGRVKNLYSPLGQNPLELFHFDKKINGMLYAIVRSFKVHLRCAFPKLWKGKYNVKC